MLVRDPITLRAVNPRLVYALECQKKTLVPRTYTSTVTFVASAAGAAIPSVLNEKMPSDTIIKAIEYTIRQPNNFLGNIFKPQRDVNFALDSAFEVEVETYGGPPSECVKVTTDGPIPIESFARSPNNVNPYFQHAFGEDFVLGKDMQVRIVTRTLLALAANEVPTQVFYTFKTMQIDDCCMRTVPLKEVLEWLQSKERLALLGR